MLVGDDPASEIYVRNKLRAGGGARRSARIWSGCPRRRRSATRSALVERLNGSPAHDGILVQSPLPAAMGAGAEQRVFDAIDPAKDVDGFNAENVGLLVQKRDGPGRLHAPRRHRAARPIERSRLPGARAVVIGRSDIVGKPMALLLLHRDATVTICHSKTRDLAVDCRRGRHPGRGDRATRRS